MRRNRIVLSLLAAAIAVGVTAACARAGAGDAASADGKQALTASLSGLRAGNYTFTRNEHERGAIQLPRSSLIESNGSSILRVGSDLYLSYDVEAQLRQHWAGIYRQAIPKATGKQKAEYRKAVEIIALMDGTNWFRADEKRLVAATHEERRSDMESRLTAPTAAAPDVTGATALVEAATSAKVSGTTITGTLDATKVDAKLEFFTNDPYYFYGPRAKSMTYRATLDGQGRLTQLTVDVPGQLVNAASAAPEDFPSDAPAEAPEPPLVISISKYGETVAPTAPQGATDMDPVAYDLFANGMD